MRTSELVMTLCAISDHEEKHGLTSGQRAYRTKLRNILLNRNISDAREDLRKAASEFFTPINHRILYNARPWERRYRRDVVFQLRDSRIKLNKLLTIKS